jgi:RNA polymerase sigma-70 factor (ECF subfamily)
MTIGDPFEQVLTAARLGEEWAWETLYRDLAPLVRGYIRGRGADDPDDVTGEVFVDVVRNVHRFEGDERRFRTWVLTIAHRRLLDSRRRSSRRVTEVELEDRDEPAGDVEQEALDRLASQSFLRSIGRLSPDQRSVLLLRIVGDLTIEEVASVVGKRPGAVKALQRRALARLKKEISPGA